MKVSLLSLLLFQPFPVTVTWMRPWQITCKCCDIPKLNLLCFLHKSSTISSFILSKVCSKNQVSVSQIWGIIPLCLSAVCLCLCAALRQGCRWAEQLTGEKVWFRRRPAVLGRGNMHMAVIAIHFNCVCFVCTWVEHYGNVTRFNVLCHLLWPSSQSCPLSLLCMSELQLSKCC